MNPRDGTRCRPALFMVDAPPQRGVKTRVASLPALLAPVGFPS
jgi:hypothetical protein